MPYNYLFNENARKSIGLKCNDKILVMDEFHNTETIAEDCNSFFVMWEDIFAKLNYP